MSRCSKETAEITILMSRKNRFLAWVAVSFFAIVIVYSVVRDFYREKMLVDSKRGVAVIVNYSEGTSKHGKRGYFEYSVDGQLYDFIEEGDFSNLRIGDTVEIEYSVEDNGIVRVVNVNYSNSN